MEYDISVPVSFQGTLFLVFRVFRFLSYYILLSVITHRTYCQSGKESCTSFIMSWNHAISRAVVKPPKMFIAIWTCEGKSTC